MSKQAYLMRDEDLSKSINQAKDILIDFLGDEGLLSKEQVENYTKNYGFIVAKPSFFSNFWSNLSKDQSSFLLLVKLVQSKYIEESFKKNE